MPQPTAKTNPIVIKKYANRRLYNTDTSSYVTLDDLCQMIKAGEEVIVFDAKNGDDITRSVLTQIIVEQESKAGQNLLPTSFLRQLISMYGNNMQGLVPRYLEYTMQTFTKNQSQMQDYFRTTFGGAFGGMFGNTFEEMSKQNLAMVEQAMRMFAPFGGIAGGMAPGAAPQNQGTQGQGTSPQPEPASDSGEDDSDDSEEGPAAGDDDAPAQSHLRAVPSPAAAPAEKSDGSIKDMQSRLNDLQKQIASMQKGE